MLTWLPVPPVTVWLRRASDSIGGSESSHNKSHTTKRNLHGEPGPGKRTGTIWFFTLGLLFIGWIIDLFLIPAMDREADHRFREGEVSFNIGWILLTFLGVFGNHRMYMGKWITGIIYLLTGGLFLVGVLYDFWTLNSQISERNQEVKFG